MNTCITARNRILSFGLALAVLLGMVLVVPGPVEVYADTAGTYGKPNDGIDFAALKNKDIYFGTYTHATAFSNTEFGGFYGDGNNDLGVTYDSEKRPILWRVMDEETTGNMTMLSEYALDGYYFYHDYNVGTANQWEHSDLRKWLNSTNYEGRANDGDDEKYGFLHSNKSGFTGAELNGSVANTVVATTTYGWNNENPGATHNTTDRFYIPWGIYSNGSTPNQGKVAWSANDALSAIDTYDLSDKVSKLRGGTDVYSWLRSPNSILGGDALYVDSDGTVPTGTVILTHGVRPAFQLNPSSVIFTSKIVDVAYEAGGETQSNNYYSHIAAGGGDANFKLTIVNDGIGTLTNVPSTPVNLNNSASSFWLTNLIPSATGGDYTVNYKIVNNTGTRTIQGYGFTPAKASTHLEIDTASLANGDYTVYVWLQQNNEINSHEGTKPKHFTLTVDGSGDTYGINLDPSGTHDFGTAPEGYNPTTLEKTVEVSDTGGTGIVTDLQASLSGTNEDSFEVLAVNSNQFTIKPISGLSAGTYTATVTVAGNYAKPQTLEVEFTVTAGLALTASPNPLPNGVVGTPYNQDISGNASGGTTPYTFALDGGTTLPSGLTLNGDGTITGTPDTAVNGHTFDVVVTDNTLPTNLTDTVTYTITIVDAASDSKEITGFTIPRQVGSTIINDVAETITVTMPHGTDVTSLTPSITHTGQIVSPASGVAQDFTNPVDYTVTAADSSQKTYTVTVDVADAPSTGNEPSISPGSLEINVNESDSFTVNLGTGTNAADSATITSQDEEIATATPAQLNSSGIVEVEGVAGGKTTISIGYSGGPRHGESDKVQVTVIDSDDGGSDNGGDNGDGNEGGSGSGGSTRSGRDRSGGSNTPDRQVAKTTLPANAFTWDGRTLTINHDNITPLGLLSVRWDDETLIRGTDYGVYQGSVIVRFDADFIAQQKDGDHTVRVEFLNHTGEATVTVGETGLTDEAAIHPDNNTHNPNTGGYPMDSYSGTTDNPNTGDGRGIWPALLLGSMNAAALVTGWKRHICK